MNVSGAINGVSGVQKVIILGKFQVLDQDFERFRSDKWSFRGPKPGRVVNVQRSGDQFRILEVFQTFYWLPIAFIESLDMPGYAFDAVDSPQKAS